MPMMVIPLEFIGKRNLIEIVISSERKEDLLYNN